MLFFYLCGPSNLFLAGDPAQSVVEGVEFRFEDVRSVEYHIAKDQHVLLLQKPKTVNVNFRSHSGILNTAASILSSLFGAYPHSAKQLKEDQGIFVGPRPSVFFTVKSDMINKLLKEQLNGTVVLVHDSKVDRWKESLDNYPLIYGIRASKGLEFKSVIMLDFFSDLPKNLQNAWRELFLRPEKCSDYSRKYPEIEGQLKLLYTGVTRCIEQLFFAETKETNGGKAFTRWLTTTTTPRSKSHSNNDMAKEVALATKNNTSDVQQMAMTKDEWLSSGIENTEAAEDQGHDNSALAESFLEKAIYCFKQADDKSLIAKAEAHKDWLEFKAKVPSKPEKPPSGDEYRELEDEAAKIADRLFKENLLLQAKDLMERINPFLYVHSNEKMKALIGKLP